MSYVNIVIFKYLVDKLLNYYPDNRSLCKNVTLKRVFTFKRVGSFEGEVSTSRPGDALENGEKRGRVDPKCCTRWGEQYF